MPFDPSIILGYKGIEVPNQLAQYGQLAQIQNAQNQNALAQFQLASAQRGEEQQSNLYKQAQTPGFKLDMQTALQYGPAGMAALKVQQDMQKQILERQKLEGDIKKQASDEIDSALSLFKKAVPGINTPEQVENFTRAQYKHPVIGKVAGMFKTEDQAVADALSQISTPQGFQQWKIANAGITGDKLIDLMKTTHEKTDVGGSISSQERDAFGNPIGSPVVTPKTAVPSTEAAMMSARAARSRVGIEREKFNWEKANPGYELKEQEDGTVVGVNKRTLQAFPVTLGGTAAAAGAAPAVGVPGAPGGAGTPLRGKSGAALTESQGNATAFGMRMKEANSILIPLEKAGVKNTGLISGAVGGTVGLVPFVGDKLEGVTGSIFNALPGILGGLSPEQQQVVQARINFITALLRKESGAAISAGEFVQAEKNYFPKPGDDPTVVAQKQKARDLAIKTMEIQAGPGGKHIQAYQPGGAGGGISGASATNPLGLPGR